MTNCCGTNNKGVPAFAVQVKKNSLHSFTYTYMILFTRTKLAFQVLKHVDANENTIYIM
jgi:hypothetical protein